jgi:hypothetical protein
LLQAICGEAMLIIASMLHFGRSGLCKKVRHDGIRVWNVVLPCLFLQPITEDDVERLFVCVRVLSEQSPLLTEVFGEHSRSVFAKMLQFREQEANADKKVVITPFLAIASPFLSTYSFPECRGRCGEHPR